jgi:hypothetical protein
VTASRRVLALLALAASLAAASAAPARAGAVPDSATRASLQWRIGHLGKVRLVGPAGETFLLEPVVRDDGLHMRRRWKAPRRALIVVGEVPAPPPPPAFVPWSEIDEVQVPRGDPARGALTGAVLGAGVSVILLAVNNDVWRRYPQEALPLVITGSAVLIAGCAVVGAVAGSYTENWRTVHPAPPEKRRP